MDRERERERERERREANERASEIPRGCNWPRGYARVCMCALESRRSNVTGQVSRVAFFFSVVGRM